MNEFKDIQNLWNQNKEEIDQNLNNSNNKVEQLNHNSMNYITELKNLENKQKRTNVSILISTIFTICYLASMTFWIPGINITTYVGFAIVGLTMLGSYYIFKNNELGFDLNSIDAPSQTFLAKTYDKLKTREVIIKNFGLVYGLLLTFGIAIGTFQFFILLPSFLKWILAPTFLIMIFAISYWGSKNATKTFKNDSSSIMAKIKAKLEEF